MYATIFFVDWYCDNKGFIISTNVALVVLSASNNRIVTWWGHQVSSMKFTTKKNVSYQILDIQRLKMILAFHTWLTKITHTYPFFVTMLGRCFETNWIWVGNLTFGSIFITNLLNQEDSTTEMLWYPLQTWSTKSSMNFSWTKFILE